MAKRLKGWQRFILTFFNPIGSMVYQDGLNQEAIELEGQNEDYRKGLNAYQTEADKIIAAELAKRQAAWVSAEDAQDAADRAAQQAAQAAQVQKILIGSFIAMLVLILAFIIIKKKLKK